MSNKPDKYIAVTVTVARQKNLDQAIVKAVLDKLGLKTAEQLILFSAKNNYGDIVAYCLKYVHFGDNYTGIAKAVRVAGSVTATVNVAVGIVNEIKTFFGQQVIDEIKNRADDAARQVETGAVNAADGIGKNAVEGLNDLNYGGGRAVRGTWNAMTSPVGSERFRSGASDFSEGSWQFGKGLGKIFIQSPLDAGLMFGGRLIGGFQTLVGLEHIGRELNAAEKAILQNVFGSSVEFDAIRIKEGYAGLMNVGDNNGFTLINNQRALTHGNTIYMKNEPPGTDKWNSTLVHETTHVWQNQHGGTDYMSEALYAQIFGDGYGYANEIFNKNKTWVMLNPEQQGQLIQDAFENGYFSSGGWSNVKPIYYTSQNQTQMQIPTQFIINYMNQVKPQLYSGQGAT